MTGVYRLILLFAFLVPINVMGQELAPHGEPDAEAVDRVLQILSDDATRQDLIEDLRAIRKSLGNMPAKDTASGLETEPSPAKAVAPSKAAARESDAILSQTGLLGALAEWMTEVVRRLPNAALGAPINVRLEEAEGQITTRLAESDARAQLKEFLAAAAPAWAIAVILFWSTGVFVRSRLPVSDLLGPRGASFAKGFIVQLTANFLPALLSIAGTLLIASLLKLPAHQVQLVLLPAAPFAIAATAYLQFRLLLALLGRSRGWRLVVYAQKRLAPWSGIIIGLSTMGSVMATPAAQQVVGGATADIAALVLDLAATIVSLIIVFNHRRTIRSLIVKRGHSPSDLPKSRFHWAVTSLGNRWHVLAYVFLTLNMVARLLGIGRGSFILQSLGSLLIIVSALILVSTFDRRFELYRERYRRKWKTGARDAIAMRLALVARSLGQLAIFTAATATCLGMWGFDVWNWIGTATGAAVIRPIFAIAMTLLGAWILWISLDAWIESALTLGARGGPARSARIKTLLPLLRNFAFVMLAVLIVIAVLANLGVNVAPLLAGAGVVGLAVGFGSQQLVQDVITGLFILLEDTLAIGDLVDTGDRSGTVEALTIRTVRIRDGDGALHSVPFSSIKALKNSSRDFGIYTVSITLDPSADVDKAVEIMKQVGRQVAEDPKYSSLVLIPLEVWGVDQVTPDGIVLKGGVRTHPLQQWAVGREINRRLIAELHEAGIPVASRSLLNLPARGPAGAEGPAAA